MGKTTKGQKQICVVCFFLTLDDTLVWTWSEVRMESRAFSKLFGVVSGESGNELPIICQGASQLMAARAGSFG